MLNQHSAVGIGNHLDEHKGCLDASFRLLVVRKAVQLRVALEEAAELDDLPDLGPEYLQFLLDSLLEMVEGRLAIPLPDLLALGFCRFRPLEQIGVVGEPFALALYHAHHGKYVNDVIGASLLGAIVWKMGVDVIAQVFEHDSLLLLYPLDGDVSYLADHLVVVVHR